MADPTVMRLQTCPLHEAASKNDTEAIEKLLEQANDISKRFLLDLARNNKGQTPLLVAAEHNCYGVVAMLIREGCDANAQDDSGNTALHIAEQNGFTQIIQCFLNWPFLKDVKNKDGDTALHFAVLNWEDESIDGAKYKAQFYMKYMSPATRNAEGYNPFHLAIKLDNIDAVETFLKRQPQLAQMPTGNGEPPLWVALKYGHLKIMQILLYSDDCNVNQKNTKIGAPTIWLAIYRQKMEAIDILLKSPGFDMATLNEASRDGTSPLLLAMIKGDKTQVHQLVTVCTCNDEWNTLALKVKYALATDVDFEKVRKNPELLGKTNSQRHTLLHLALLSDSHEMVKKITEVGGKISENAITLAKKRQCQDILDLLGIPCENPNIYSVSKDFPRFSDNIEDLFYPLTSTNKPWLVAQPNAIGQILYEDVKKHFIPRVNIKWTKTSDIKKDKHGLPLDIPSLSHLLPLNKEKDGQNTLMMRYFLSILAHIETYLREEDELFKHLNVALLPVGSTVEGTKVGRLNELDVMFYCTKLHGFLSVKDECTICISKDKYIDLPLNIRDLFDTKTKKLNMAKFFSLFMQSIRKVLQDLVAKNKVPNNVELFLEVKKCSETDCNTGEEWSQCYHKEPPCVCYTAVGAGLNFVWKGKENTDIVFTMDIVPNFYVDLNGLSNFSLRQKLIQYLMDQKPLGWVEFLKKYIRDDRIYLGQYDLEEKTIASFGIKMVNSKGDFVIRPGLNMHVQEMLKNEVVHETYCFLKVFKEVTASKVKSFDLKKAISDQLKGSMGKEPKDVFSFAIQILNSPDLQGKFDELCHSLTKQYMKVDLVDFPAKNSSTLAVQLISKDATELVEYIKTGNLKKFQHLTRTKERYVIKNMVVKGQSLLHYASEYLRNEIIKDLLKEGCEANSQDLMGNTALHCFLLAIIRLEGLKQHVEYENLKIIELLISHLSNDDLKLQNKTGKTVLHLLACMHIGSKVAQLMLSKASQQVFDIRDQDGRTAMVQACLYKDKNDMVTSMVSKGANVNIKDNEGFTALHFASESNNCFLIDLLLTNGANIEERNNKLSTPLTRACMGKDDCESVKLLLDRGAEVNTMDYDGCTPLYVAVFSENFDIAHLLVKSGADVNKAGALGTPLYKAVKNLNFLQFLVSSGADVNKDYPTPLYKASEEGLFMAAQFLLQSGAKVDRGNDERGLTPLYIASDNGHLNVVELLLKNGASVNLATKIEGSSPLYAASQNDHLEVAKFLLNNGAFVDLSRRDTGATPLTIASQIGNTGVVKLLLQNGANVNKKDKRNSTPLITAAMNGRADIVRLLMRNKADMSITYKSKFTALHFACFHGHLSVIKILVEEGGAMIDGICIGLARQSNKLEIVEYLLRERTR